MPTAYITAPRTEAHSLAEELVETDLAACVNRIPCKSTYTWEGEVVSDAEEILLAKTSSERYPELVAHIEEAHPYDIPCIERFDEAEMTDAFAAWIGDATAD